MSGHQEWFDQLKGQRDAFTISVESLPADLALVGLVDDVLDAAAIALDVVDQQVRAAYPLVRTAFEAAQRIVALGTDDDYLSTGTRAWLYYQRKDSNILRITDVDRAGRWLEAAVARLVRIWAPHNQQAEILLAAAATRLDEFKKQRRPDNFMGEELAELVQSRYARMPGLKEIGPNMRRMNRSIYSVLSRESHARLRLDIAGLSVRADGSIGIVPRRTDDSAKRRTLLACVETTLTEAVSAMTFLDRSRARAGNQSPFGADARPERSTKDLPPGFKPDLGLHLSAIGGARTTFHFTRVPVTRFGVFQDGTITWSANIVLNDGEYAVSFDVPPNLSRAFSDAVGIQPSLVQPGRGLIRQEVAPPALVRVQCMLGKRSGGKHEEFIPMRVKDIQRREKVRDSP